MYISKKNQATLDAFGTEKEKQDYLAELWKKLNEAVGKWRTKNPEKFKEYQERYRKENPEKQKTKNARYRAKKKAEKQLIETV